jgi:hypothetical protein
MVTISPEHGDAQGDDGRPLGGRAEQRDEHDQREGAERNGHEGHGDAEEERLLGEEAGQQKQGADGEAGVGQVRDALRLPDVGAGRHRQHLHHRAAHRLQHEADRDEMGERQCDAGPARGERRRSLPEQQQSRRHAEQRRGEEEAEGHRDGRCLLEGQARLHLNPPFS